MLRKLSLLILMTISLHAVAGNFAFLPANTGTEKEFRTLMESGDYSHAMMAWGNAHRATAFGQSHSGVATWSYLLLQNGMPFTALETLIGRTDPAKMDSQLVKMWTTELKNSALIQKGFIATSGGWTKIVNNEVTSVKLKSKADIVRAFARANATPKDNPNAKARILWQIATQAPQFGDTDSSLKAIKLMRESGQNVIAADQIIINQARVLYQKGEVDAALNIYAQIPKGSSLWIDAVEERAWAHLRQQDYDKAMGVVTTAMSPVLAPLAGPETFFLANLMAYRVCDYARLFKNSETFKLRHRTRLADTQELAQKGTNHAIDQVFASFEQNGVSQESAGALVESLPRGLVRDTAFVRAMESRRALLAEISRASKLLENTETLGGNPDLEKSIALNRSKADRFHQQAFQRARVLAQTDLREYRMILNKMHIIEGEVIQRLSMDENLKGQRSKLAQKDDSGDVLVFPYTNEVWMDELDNYQARVKDCPTLKGASL